MKPFQYVRASDVSSAITLVLPESDAQFFAGGTSQVDLMKEGVQLPSLLVDISRLPLTIVKTMASGGLRIGATLAMPSLETIHSFA